MKEVTRIHIAKTVYNVEVEAKKELEKYMKDLEVSANNGEVSAGVVKNLNVAQPDSCPDRDNTENSVEVADVTGEFIYNGEKQSPGNLENPCGIVKINSKED